MKQITLVLHYDDDEHAEDMYQLLKQAHRYGRSGSIVQLHGTDIRHLEINGPNDQPGNLHLDRSTCC